jgi:membrane protease subunit HflC
MSEIQKQVQNEAKNFGIDVIDVRIRRADLPQANSEAIFARMKSEREREAKEFRAQGAELAQRIRARADRERTVLLADAHKQAQILRGEGDAEQVQIWAKAANQDPNFFAFYRSMEAYREALGSDTTLVLEPDSDFFSYFRDLHGKPANAGKPAGK